MISWSPNTYKCDQSQWRMVEGGMFDVGDTGWLVLLELTHDLHLLMSLYMRDTPVWLSDWDRVQYLQMYQ